ncbi:MAG: serine/threonine protein kinase, partial [Thermomicrobia bacterium]|nr:serine/threonine protein kinase [Thermomicrobia bacterium]
MASSSGSGTTSILLDRYRVEATLGEGSFGTVARAFDTRLKRTVAIKTLKRSLATADIGQFRAVEERFAREAEAGSRMG